MTAAELAVLVVDLTRELSQARRQDDFIVDLVVESQAYRALAQAAIHEVHRLGLELQRLQEAHMRLHREYRWLRERTMREAA